ncbi:hypothetical protein ACVXZ4_02040 [Lacisediminihabitans sp. FW035]
MLPALEVAMLLPGAVGVCCTVADQRTHAPLRRAWTGWAPVTVAPSIVMMLAMADLATGGRAPLVPSIGWIALLLLVALVPVVRLRFDRAVRTPVGTAMAVHRSLTLLLTATTIAAMGLRSAGGDAAAAGGGVHDGMTMANPLVVLLVLGLVTVAALTFWLVARLGRRPRSNRVAIVEAVSMFGGVVVMAGVGM